MRYLTPDQLNAFSQLGNYSQFRFSYDVISDDDDDGPIWTLNGYDAYTKRQTIDNVSQPVTTALNELLDAEQADGRDPTAVGIILPKGEVIFFS